MAVFPVCCRERPELPRNESSMGSAMTISAEDAGAMLAEIELIKRRVQQSSIYRASSMIVMGRARSSLSAISQESLPVDGRGSLDCA
jgi:hypothetical protein